MSLVSSYLSDLAYWVTNCFCCFPGSPSLKINGRSFKILRLLGEGGFSYVYLVQTTSPPQSLYALKKIRCPFGQESVSQALREVEAYSLFAPHPNIIHCVDHSIVDGTGSSSSRHRRTSSDPSQKTVYILLPYFARGNLQDVINANLVNRTRLGERRLMILVKGVCRGLKAMHQYKVGKTGAVAHAKRVKGEAARADREMEREMDDGDASEEVEANSSKRRRKHRKRHSGAEDEEPLMEEDEMTASHAGKRKGETRAYAHRDIKPGNIMISPHGTHPILMDLGSLAPSPTPIRTRSEALHLQDTAAENSTLPYRAPELLDVRVGTPVDTKVDIWSLGCTIYACLVGKSPFERRSEETGGSLTMCILGGDWRFPDEAGISGPRRTGSGFNKGKGRTGAPADDATGVPPPPGEELVLSESVKEIVRRCLRVEPGERPDVDELTALVDEAVSVLPRGEDEVDEDEGGFVDREVGGPERGDEEDDAGEESALNR